MSKVAVVITYGFNHRAAVVMAPSWDEAVKYIKDSCEHEFRMYNQLHMTDAALEYTISDDGVYAEMIAHRDTTDDVTTWRIGDIYEWENVLHE